SSRAAGFRGKRRNSADCCGGPSSGRLFHRTASGLACRAQADDVRVELAAASVVLEKRKCKFRCGLTPNVFASKPRFALPKVRRLAAQLFAVGGGALGSTASQGLSDIELRTFR